MKAFILAENDGQAKALCQGARTFVDSVEAIVLGHEATDLPADVVWHIAYPEEGMAEDATETIIELCKSEIPDYLFVEPTRRNKLIIGRVAAAIGASAIPDVIKLLPDGSAHHLVFGGLAHCAEKACTKTAIFLINTSVFPETGENGSPEVKELPYIEPAHLIKRIGVAANERASVDLGSAEKVIGIGRGIAEEKDIELVRSLAGKIGAEIGCTRPIAEGEKWLPRETYIGVSGAMLAPDLYLAIGVSGQIQHTVGINRAKTIIAINKDKSAPIFKQADYGIVGDLYKVVPSLTEAL